MTPETIVISQPSKIKKMPLDKNTSFGLNSITEDENRQQSDLFQSMKGFLIFGVCIGVIPYRGVFSRSSTNLRFSWISIPALMTYIIVSILTLNTILASLTSAKAEKKNAYQIAQSVRTTLYYWWATLIYFNFIFRHSSFFNMIRAWNSTSIYYSKPDLTLKRDLTLIAFTILFSATVENFVLNMTTVEGILDTLNGPPSSNNMTFLELYYSYHKSWTSYISYSPFVSILAFVKHRWILFAWNYIDVLIAILGRAIYFKFKALTETAKEMLLMEGKEKPRFANNPEEIEPPNRQGWTQLARDHITICKLLNAFETFLSPLIFISYTVNIYYICMQLVDGLMDTDTEKKTISRQIYNPLSFIHLIMRIYIVSICCARINMHAHEVGQVVQKCPSECYTKDVSRLDKQTSGGRDIGLTGLGCFTITKPFILGVIGVIFTFEIVLLQVHPSTTTASSTSCCSPCPAPS